jgi:CRP-like cAMP-binding protein
LDSTAFVADQELILALKERATDVDCSQDRVLFRQGDEPTGLYILHRGEVTMSMRAPNGELVVQMAMTPGSLLGLPGVIGNHGYSLSAEARQGAEIGFVPREEFSRLMLSEPSLSMMILRVLAAEVRTARVALTGS